MNALTAIRRPEAALEAAAFVADPEAAAAVRAALSDRYGADVQVIAGASEHALDWLAETLTPGLLVVDLSDCEVPLERLERLAEHCAPGTRVIALGLWNDIALYRRMIALGVDDYLTLPLGAAEFRAALDRLSTSTEEAGTAAGDGSHGRRAVVIGVRGGVGATTVALGLAWAQARGNDRESSALLDLDLSYGDAALLLDREPAFGLAAALAAPDRIDSLLVSRAGLKIDERLTIYGGPEGAPGQPAVAPEALSALLGQIGEGHGTTVIDLPRWMTGLFAPVVADAVRVFLVAQPTLGCMRDAIRLREMISGLSSASVDLVLNRVRRGGEKELEPAMMAKAFGARPLAVFPEDARLAVRASAKARPMVALSGRRSPHARGFGALCAALTGAGAARRSD
ncbi:MAG: hypothetical protein TEF_10200 [Rhizobiales bacterium NRL2]|nr:MAG: hypothetical protein TEF_10200 [Rhizobiales bacterium NRL2]